MSSLKAFFAQNVQSDITEEFVVSERFKDESGKPIPWKIRTLSEAENEEIRKASTQYVKGKGGQRVPETKPEIYLAKVAVASVVFPDLKDADLQKSYGVIGAEELLKKMLLAGEYATLIQKVQEINGFERDINDLVDEVKN
ncbi:phage tail assembly chaperone [Paenibacillus naphthalenovorans]|uniref:phage tail assembly chaperone n=1 Tax=Paenibacillus naphthalenovorans TaxID=162209 RepID=UPI003D2CD49E